MKSEAFDWESLPIVPYGEAVQDGKAPIFVTVIDREHTPSEYVVRRTDGSYVRILNQHPNPRGALVNDIPTHTRAYLREWLTRVEGKWPQKVVAFKRLLLDDARMRGFWAWFEGAEPDKPRSKYLHSSITATEMIWRATVMPGKPGDMTPKQRDEYFGAVRKHALALIELLDQTTFDGGVETPLTDDQLEKTLDKALNHWGDDEDEDGHIVAFRVTPFEKYALHYNYPSCALVQTLYELREWTYWDDNWDGRYWGSSAPIVQSNSKSTRVVYFTCSLHADFLEKGLDMPFPILATLAEVALNLSEAEQVNEETVRRQVRRHQERIAQRAREREYAF